MLPEDIQDDLDRMDYNDPELKRALENVRAKFKAKGLPYHELVKSKFYRTIKYLLRENNDEHGTVLITDLDTNQTYRFVDGPQVRSMHDHLQDWIHYTNKAA